jgi:glycosyltransferase involved in cell wall biosynthesis
LFGRDGIFGGGERYSFELARHMAQVVPTTLLAFGEKPGKWTMPEGLKVQVLGPAWSVRGQKFNPMHLGIIPLIASADVVHAHQTNILASEFAALIGRFTARRVFTSDLGGGGWCLGARFCTSRWFHRHLHISEYSRMLAGKVDDSMHRVIWGGVDTHKFRPDPSLAKEPLVVYAGRLMPHKGIDNLIEALPEGLILEVIGRPYHNEYFEKLKHLAVGRKVVFRTQCDDAEMIRAYQRAMCVVLPSVYRDCYGNETRVPELLGQTPLEAMACGTPAIVTRVASLPEVVEDGQTGFVVPPNDPAALKSKLEWLRDHPVELFRMGVTGRNRVEERFTWNAVVNRCLDIYSDVN